MQYLNAVTHLTKLLFDICAYVYANCFVQTSAAAAQEAAELQRQLQHAREQAQRSGDTAAAAASSELAARDKTNAHLRQVSTATAGANTTHVVTSATAHMQHSYCSFIVALSVVLCATSCWQLLYLIYTVVNKRELCEIA
jgi:hypothetical protein